MKKYLDIFLRYFILIAVSFGGFYLLSAIITPLTIYPLFFLISLFYESSVFENIINFNSQCLEIIPSCISISAYYLLLILNLSTANIKIKKRLLVILTSFLFLLVLNILRIFFLGIISSYDMQTFEILHKFTWYFLSTIFIILIWFFHVKYFEIKSIPFYSDVRFILEKISPKKKHKKIKNKEKKKIIFKLINSCF